MLRIPYWPRPVERVEQRPRPHALGDEEGQREIVVLAFLEQAPRQPVVVERPAGKERGAAVGIVLQRPERFHGVDGGQRVANGRGARLGVPAVSHVSAGAFGLRSGTLGARCRFKSPQLRRPGFPRVGGRVERRFNPGADRLVMRLSGRGRQREALLHVLHGRWSPFRRAGEELRKGSVAPDHHQLVFGSHARLEGALGQPNQLLATIRRREQALLHRRRLERVVSGRRLRRGVSRLHGERVEATEHRERFVNPARTGRDNPQEGQDLTLQPIRPLRKARALGLFQETERVAQIPSRLLDVPRLQAPRLRLQNRILRRVADLDDALHLSSGLVDATERKQEVPEIAAREQFAFGSRGRPEAIGGLSVQSLGAIRVARAVHVSVGQRQPQIARMGSDEIVEYPRPLVPSALVDRDLIEAVGRLVVVGLLRESLPARGERIRPRHGADASRPGQRQRARQTKDDATYGGPTHWRLHLESVTASGG